MKQICILVLGMHRSGTSALTGTLERLGVYLGEDLMAANDANPKGYFENNKLYRINEKLLYQSKSSWRDVFYDEKKIEAVDDLSELKALITEEFGYSKTFAIKDPRLIYLFPLYERALKELGIRIKVIIPYRNPYEVASSLHKRDGFSMEKGMLLWAYHFILAEKYSRKYDRVFVGFDDLLAHPKKTVAKIDDALHLKLLKKYDDAVIRDFLSSDLKHHNIDIDNLSNKVPPVIRKLIAMRSYYNDPASKKKFDRLGRELFGYREMFYNEDFREVYDELERLKAQHRQIGHKSKETEELLQASAAREAELKEELQERTSAYEARLSELERKLENKTRKHAEELEEVRQAHETREGELKAELQERTSAYEARLSELERKLENETRKHAKELEKVRQAHETREKELRQRTSDFEARLSERKISEDGLRNELQEKSTLVAGFEKQVGEWKRKAEQNFQELSEKNRELERLRKQIKVTQEKVDAAERAKEKAVKQRDAKIKDLEHELILIYTGRSWKLTRPLRKLKRMFR